MRRRVPVNLERLRIFVRKQAQVGVFFERPSQVDQIAIGLCRQRRIRQPRADRPRNVERGRAFGNFFGAPVGELDMNTLVHRSIRLLYFAESFEFSEGQSEGSNGKGWTYWFTLRPLRRPCD